MKKVQIIIIIIFIILALLCGCCKPPSNSKEIPLVWSYDELSAGAGDMLLVDQMLIVKGGGNLIALNKQTGEFIWKSEAIGSVSRSPLLVNNNIVVVGSNYIVVIGLDGKTKKTQAYDYSPNSGSGYNAYATNTSDKIYVIWGKNQSYLPKVVVEIDINSCESTELFTLSDGYFSSRLVEQDNILYVSYMAAGPSEDPYAGLIAYDLGTHTEKWHTPFDGDGIYSYNPIIYDNKIYISVDDYMREVDLETGEEIRKFYGQGFDGSSIGNGVIFLAGWMRGYFLDTGEPVWEGGLAHGDVASGSIFYKGSFYSFPRGLCRVEARTGKYLNDFTWERNENTEPVWKWDSTWWMPLLDESTNILYINGFRGVFAFKLPE